MSQNFRNAGNEDIIMIFGSGCIFNEKGHLEFSQTAGRSWGLGKE